MRSRTEYRVIAAAGGVVWRPSGHGAGGHGGEGIEIAVVHRERHDDWSLPKGHVDGGEHALQAACREVVEETGLGVVAGRRGLTTRYEVEGATKRVDYWIMRCVGGTFAANDEVEELRWLPPAEAAALCSYEHDRQVIADAARTDLPREVSVLLVRHGRAGSKGAFDGPDELRPLDGKGRRQAQRLAEVLGWFPADEGWSAPPLRCRQTLEPLADRMGLDVQVVPELGEEGFAADPRAGLAFVERLLERRDRPGVAVVCSQGGAIPAVLQALGVHGSGAAGPLPPSAKGSVWALGGRAGALTADYYRDFAPDPDARLT